MRTLTAFNSSKPNLPASPIALVRASPKPRRLSVTSSDLVMPQRQLGCACGGGCPHCQEESQRSSQQKMAELNKLYEKNADASSFENYVAALLGGGQPLSPSERAFFEPRFGTDFSQVRIHAGRQASETANAIDARAFTLGQDIVFGARQYQPNTSEGKQLLAHELTHVIQQAHGQSLVQRQGAPRRPRPAPVDANAQRIIDLAQDTSRPIAERAVAVVQAIIDEYFPRDRSKISRIRYREREPGLHITSTGRGASITGILDVGRYFVENTTQPHFARRVLQVRHEIEHVEQYRAGMTGANRQDEREFLAFYHEARATELPGTGRLQHSTRVRLIDAALGYYYCLSADLQRANTTRRTELIDRRTDAVRQSGRSDLGEAPTTCQRQHP